MGKSPLFSNPVIQQCWTTIGQYTVIPHLRYSALYTTLLDKLQSYGIDDVELQWIGYYLISRKQKVTFDNTSSCDENITWCPTRIHHEPLLFGLIINDIHIPLTGADIMLYADDTVL